MPKFIKRAGSCTNYRPTGCINNLKLYKLRACGYIKSLKLYKLKAKVLTEEPISM